MTEKSEKEYGAGSGTLRCYVVEARCSMPYPQLLTTGDVLDNRWQRVRFPRGAISVKVQLWNRMAEAEDYLDFAAANALAWWFMANAEYQVENGMRFRAIGVETRLVQLEFAYSYSAKERGVGEAMTEHDDRGLVLKPRSEVSHDADA